MYPWYFKKISYPKFSGIGVRVGYGYGSRTRTPIPQFPGSSMSDLRSISMVILIVVINVSNCYHINKNFTHVEERIAFNRSRCTFVERSLLRLKRNKLILIKMLFYKSLLYICGNFFFIVGAFVYMHLDGGHSNPYFPFIQLSINTLIFISLGLN